MSNFPKLLCCNDSIKIYTSLLQQNEHIVSQTLSLHDPASLLRMQVPCRAFDCEHLQCFDYSVILLLNKSNERSFFKCSVCNETRNPDKIYIDFVAFCLLRMYKCSESFKLYRDGTLRPSGPISPEYKGMEINTVFDIKKLCVLPDFQSSAIHLRQLLYTSVFDINDYINKSGSAVLLKLITKGCRKLPSKDAELTLGIDKLRPFNSNTWLGLQHSFQTLPSVGDKKGASLVKDLREEYDKVSLNHLNKITSGPLDAEDNDSLMACGSVYEIKKMEDVMVDLCDDDDDEETPVRPFIKTALEAPSSSSLSAAVATTALLSAAPSSSSSYLRVIPSPRATAGSSSNTSSNRQLDTPNASAGHVHANHQGSAIATASNNASLPNTQLNNPHIVNHDLEQSVARAADRLRRAARSSDLPPAQFANALSGRVTSAPPNNFNVPLPLRRENGLCPEPARGRNNLPADSAPSSSSFLEHSSAACRFISGNGHLNPNNSSSQDGPTVRPRSPMIGMSASAGPTASLSKPCRKPLTGANSPGGASTAVICRGEVGQSMLGRLPRVQRSVEMRPSGAPTRTAVVSYLDDRIAAFNRWLLRERVSQSSRSTQTECMDGSSFTDVIRQSSATERSISSRPLDSSSSSAGVSMDVSTDTHVETSNSRAQGGLENPTLYWLDPTGILMGDHGLSNQAQAQPAPSGTGGALDDDGDVTMDCHDEMDDDMQAILCAQIDQMNSEATGGSDERMEIDRVGHVSANFEGYEVNSNYSSSDCESIGDNVILDQNQDQNQNQNYDTRNISSIDEGDTNAADSSSDRYPTAQHRDDSLNMQNSGPNVETNISNSSITASNTGGSRDQGFGSSSSRDDVAPGHENSLTPTDNICLSNDGVITGVVDDWTVRLVDRVSASSWARVAATSSADIIAASTAPVSVTTEVDSLAAHEDPGPCPALTATVTVTAGMAPASDNSEIAVAVGSNGTLSHGPEFDLENLTSEEISDFLTEGTPDNSGETTESEDEMFDGRGSATRKIKKSALVLPQEPADSAVVVGEAGSARIAVEGEQSDVMWRDVIAAAWAEIETEAEPDVGEGSQSLSSSQSIANATQSAVDTTAPENDSESLGSIVASTESIPSTANTGIPSTISAVSAVGDSTSAATSAESTTHVYDASIASTSSPAPLLPQTTAMDIFDPSSSSIAPEQSEICSSQKDISVGGSIPNPSSSLTEMPAERPVPADATRETNSVMRTALPSTYHERIYNSSGRCNATSTAPSVPAYGYRRKTPLDVSSTSSAESINRTLIIRTMSSNISRDATQPSVDSTVPPSSSSSFAVPTITAAAPPISELLPTATSSVLRQTLPSLTPLNIPTDSILQPSASTLTAPALIPFSSNDSSTSVSLAIPASSPPITPPAPTVQPAVTVLPAVSAEPLLTPPLLGNQMGTVLRREAEQAAAAAVAKELSTEPPAATIPKRKSAAASPRTAEVQDPTAVTGVTPHTAAVVSASSAAPPSTVVQKALESATQEGSSSRALPQGENQLFSSDDYGFWDEGGNMIPSERGNASSESAPQSTAQRVGTSSDAPRIKHSDKFYLSEENRAAERAAKKAEKRRKIKKYGPTPDGIAEWAYHLAKGTQCKDLIAAKKEAKNANVPNTKKKLEQWYRAVSRLTTEGHYTKLPEEDEIFATAPVSTSSSSSSSAALEIAVEIPVPSQPIVHATAVADWKCGKCRRIIDGNKRLCTECNTARQSEVTARTTDILRRCPSCSITPSTLPCAACAAMVPAIRAAFKPMTVLPKAGNERRSALSHEKPPYVEPVNTGVGPNKRPLPSEGLNGAPSDQDNKNKAKVIAKKAAIAKETAMYMAALKAVPSPAPVRNTMTQHPTEKAKKAKTVLAPSSSSSTHSTAGAPSGAAVTPNSASVTASADAPSNTAAAAAPIAKAAASSTSSSTSGLYIDLTLDDDDEIDEFGRAKQTSPPTAPGSKVTSVAQDSSVKRKHSTAFGGAEDPSRSGDTAGTKKKAVKKGREAGSAPNPTSTASNTTATVQPKPKPPPSLVAHNPSSSNTASTGHPRPPITPYPNSLSSLHANAKSSINPSYSVIPRPIIGQSSQLAFSINSVQARPIASDKSSGPNAPQGEKVRPTRPITKSVPANITLNESDSQETSFSVLCANDFSFP
jgi:MIZ/SP-RING zinc finger